MHVVSCGIHVKVALKIYSCSERNYVLTDEAGHLLLYLKILYCYCISLF